MNFSPMNQKTGSRNRQFATTSLKKICNKRGYS